MITDNDPDDFEDELQDYSGRSPIEKTVRRRSSKACDNCRKAKCKCERSGGSNDPCRNCVLLAVACTFLGPSRKRGPPKGYIDAIESRLHQTEALLAVIISSPDPRARSLVSDLSINNVARDVFSRIDDSPFGRRGRAASEFGNGKKGDRKGATGNAKHTSTAGMGNPHEWQDELSELILNKVGSSQVQPPAQSQGYAMPYSQPPPPFQNHPTSSNPSLSCQPSLRLDTEFTFGSGGIHMQEDRKPILPLPSMQLASISQPPSETSSFPPNNGFPTSVNVSMPVSTGSSPTKYFRPLHPSTNSSNTTVHGHLSKRHQPEPQMSNSSPLYSRASSTSHKNSTSPHTASSQTTPPSRPSSPLPSSPSSPEDSDSESSENVSVRLGQLSLDEHDQLRYHGHSSGLHLLHPQLLKQGPSTTGKRLGESGIWKFPRSGVWPPVENYHSFFADDEDGRGNGGGWLEGQQTLLPDLDIQEHLIELYFMYAHPVLPIVHKESFLRDWKARNDPKADPASRRKIPLILLLSMLCVAARFTCADTSLPAPGTLWTAGNRYYEAGKGIMMKDKCSTRTETCQAFLLWGYREIGIGSMAQAWLWIGMAVRMAQDLGLHRSMDKWRVGADRFSEDEKQTRRRIWYSCVMMDKYVSTYIGRPLAIFERDYDTPFPEIDEVEEMEVWKELPSRVECPEDADLKNEYVPSPMRVIDCFNHHASLASIQSAIVDALYSLRPATGTRRHKERTIIEERLDKWYLDLLDHLAFSTSCPNKHGIPPPHVLTLHMNYWCTVLLLHRPFIRYKPRNNSPSESDDVSSSTVSDKSFGVCTTAANQLSSIVKFYGENFLLRRCPPFLSYYIFTASIMHVTTLMMQPADVQAGRGLQYCMDALKTMEITWPSAGRAWELLNLARINMKEAELSRLENHPDRNKRSAPEDTDDPHHEERQERSSGDSMSSSNRPSPPNYPFHAPPPDMMIAQGGSSRSSTSSYHAAETSFPPYPRWTPLQQFAPPTSYSYENTPENGGGSYPYGVPPPQHHMSLPPLSQIPQLSSARYTNNGFWNDYPPSDPFGDPSLLSSSLYTLPIMQSGGVMAPGDPAHHNPPPPMAVPPGYDRPRHVDQFSYPMNR